MDGDREPGLELRAILGALRARRDRRYRFTGALFLGPGSARMGQLIEERGPDDPEVLAHNRRILTVSRVDLLVLTLVVVDMVVKPFL
jgi:hypothetical protein